MKKSGQYLFESQLRWTEDSKGIISAKGISEEITVATPISFKGQPDEYLSPEHLLISAVSSCFMTTCLFYAKQKSLAVTGFKCEAIGRVELHNGKLKFTEVNIYPVLGIESPEQGEKAKEVVELTKQNCLISKALSVIIYYHPVIRVMEHIHADKREFFF